MPRPSSLPDRRGKPYVRATRGTDQELKLRMKNSVRVLALCAAAMTMLVIAPASQAKGHHHKSHHKSHKEHQRHHSAASIRAFCDSAAQNSQLTTDQRAAIAAACDQLKTDLQTAQSTFDAAVSAAQDSVTQADAARDAACGNGQGDTQACRDARAADSDARHQ